MTRDKPFRAENQQGSSFRKRNPSETTRRAPLAAEFKAYLLGALHDGTYNRLHRTFRFSQKGKMWLMTLKHILYRLGHKSWLYQEGKKRSVYALETSARFLDLHFDPLRLRSTRQRVAYVRGYFDSEGGIPHSSEARFYIQLCQKNREEMIKVSRILETLGIHCGTIHNPSKAADPDYWRFFVRTESHQDFIQTISSWHPRKHRILQHRRKMI